MPNYCGQCTYLDLSTGNINGKFYCDKKWERHLATDIECDRFCRAYSRDYNSIQNAYRYSNEKTSSGCYLTTMLCHILGMGDDNIYLQTIRNFRDNVLQKNTMYKALLVEYDIVGPKIAEALNNDPLKEMIAKKHFNFYIVAITNLIKSNQYDMAISLYAHMTNSLRDLYSLNNISPTTLEVENADIKNSGHGIYKTKKIVQNV